MAEGKDKAVLSEQTRQEIDKWIAKYPADKKQSAVIPALTIVQDETGWLTTELMDAVAEYLDMEPISVYEVATFYSMFHLKPVGRHVVSICTNVSCMLCGSEEVVGHLENKLGIKLGETTEDGRFTLREVECLGSCAGAPMFQVGKTYFENLTPEKIDSILSDLK